MCTSFRQMLEAAVFADSPSDIFQLGAATAADFGGRIADPEDLKLMKPDAWTPDTIKALADKVEKGVWLPLSIIVARPFIEHLMMSAVLTVAGRDTGATLYGPAGTLYTHSLSLKLHSRHTHTHTSACCAFSFLLALDLFRRTPGQYNTTRKLMNSRN